MKRTPAKRSSMILLELISAILFLIDLYQACKYWKEDHED